ncbi:ABC transporter permease [Jiella marina]|uniref:ABC transporter permease n=1 Tax=Jiella sp. LLJ827 TaxID=2917712 RepID=UPI002101046A|nr:ABC transporter permease subunit [Jiella sp. LLJ827]MCQ0988683.1 ABC transporter permease subunit [Jiella sp. LLJ827]
MIEARNIPSANSRFRQTDFVQRATSLRRAGRSNSPRNGIAILCGIESALWPKTLRAMRGVNIAAFAIPPIALATILNPAGPKPRAARRPRTSQGVWGMMLQELRLVSVPASLPYVFAATRLTVPRAILGVMIAEWLATGTGLGNLLNQSRGFLDYGMIWTVAAVSVILSVVRYQIVVFTERRVLAARGMTTVE